MQPPRSVCAAVLRNCLMKVRCWCVMRPDDEGGGQRQVLPYRGNLFNTGGEPKLECVLILLNCFGISFSIKLSFCSVLVF
jgi:hypothetical protein